MLQRLDRTMGVNALGDEAAGCGDFGVDLWHGVGGAGDHAGVGGIEHVEVVVAIADGKAIRSREVVKPCHFREAATFVEIAVTEAQVDRVALP